MLTSFKTKPTAAFIGEFLGDESGLTAIEYGFVASLIAVAVIGSVDSIGGTLSGFFSDVPETISGTPSDTPPPVDKALGGEGLLPPGTLDPAEDGTADS